MRRVSRQRPTLGNRSALLHLQTGGALAMFDKAEIEIPCPKCRRKTAKTVAWLNQNSAFTCLCGTRIELDTSEFRREMQKANKAVADFKKSLKRLGR